MNGHERMHLGFVRADAIAVGLMLAAVAVKVWERTHFAEWFRRPDIINQFFPWWSYLGDELSSGNIPGWNPYQIGGTPFVGDPQSGWMYFPVMTTFSVLSPVAALKSYVGVHLLIAALTMYLFARVIRLGPVASLAASAAFTFGPFLHHTTYCCNVQGHVEAWIPLGLIGVELVHRATRWSVNVLGWACTGFAMSQMISGSIGQGAYDGLLVLGSYTTYRLLLTSAPGRPRLSDRSRCLGINGVAILIIGLGLSTAALLPLLDVNNETNLAGGDYGNVEELESDRGASLDQALSRLIAPGLEGRRTMIGMVTFALAMIAGVLAWRRHPVRYMVLLSVVVVVITLDTTAFHHMFFLLPRFKELHEHSPHRTLAVFMIGPATMAGIGVEILPRLSIRQTLVAAAIPIAGIAIFAVGLNASQRTYLSLDQPGMRAFVAVSVILAASAGARRWRPQGRFIPDPARLIPVLLVALLLWEPSGREVIDHLRQTPVRSRTFRIFYDNINPTDSNGAGDFLKERLAASNEPFRYIGYNAVGLRTRAKDGPTYQVRYWSPRYRRLLNGPRSVVLRINNLQGYNPIQLQRSVDLFTVINGVQLDYHDAHVLPSGIDSPWLDVLGVRYLVVLLDVPPGRADLFYLSQRYPTVFNNGRTRVVENDEVFPYGWIVHDVRIDTGTCDLSLDARGDVILGNCALALVERGDIDPRRIALLEHGTEVPVTSPPAGGTAEAVTVDRYENDEIQLTARADGAGVLVLSEMFDPGWSATVDDQPVDILVVDGILRGIPVAAGEHRVVLRYGPRSISFGLLITSVTAAGLLVGFAGLWWLERSRRRPSQPGTPGMLSGAPESPERGTARRKRSWMRLSRRVRAPPRTAHVNRPGTGPGAVQGSKSLNSSSGPLRIETT